MGNKCSKNQERWEGRKEGGQKDGKEGSGISALSSAICSSESPGQMLSNLDHTLQVENQIIVFMKTMTTKLWGYQVLELKSIPIQSLSLKNEVNERKHRKEIWSGIHKVKHCKQEQFDMHLSYADCVIFIPSSRKKPTRNQTKVKNMNMWG